MEHYGNASFVAQLGCAILDYQVKVLGLSIVFHEQHSFCHWLPTRVGHILAII